MSMPLRVLTSIGAFFGAWLQPIVALGFAAWVAHRIWRGLDVASDGSLAIHEGMGAAIPCYGFSGERCDMASDKSLTTFLKCLSLAYSSADFPRCLALGSAPAEIKALTKRSAVSSPVD